MNMSTVRSHRRVRALVGVAAVLATAGLLTACSSDDDANSDTATTASSSQAAAADSGEVTVIDQTNLLLTTAQDTLEARGLKVAVEDATGAGREIDDPTQWVVVDQDPISGTVEAGSTVTLTARMTTDPVG